MQIVFINRYQGKVERGVENYVAELGQRLQKLGCEVKVLTSFWQLLGLDLPRLNLGRLDLKIIYPLNGYWQTLGCRLYAWLTGARLVVGGHAGIGRDDRWNLYMFPDLFIAFSKKGEEWARKVNPFIKIVNIPHGVNLEKFNPNVKPVKVDLERPIVVTAAHLVEPYKRVGLTVKAVAEMKEGSLLVLGEGPMEKEIDELGKRLLNYPSSRASAASRGIPTGLPRPAASDAAGARNDSETRRYLRLQVAHDQVARYLRAADVFTLVSEESEAFGLVYLEAMACGLPVVASDDSLRRELVGDAGVFVKNPMDSREYARCLEAAVRTDWGDRPMEQAKKFDWEKIADRYLEEFTGL